MKGGDNMYKWNGSSYVDDGIRNQIVYETRNRNRHVYEFYVDDNRRLHTKQYLYGS